MNIDRSRYKVYTWKNPFMLHWMLNPGLAINEIVFGQRVPKISVEDKTQQVPRIERSFVPCPHCATFHDSRIWTTENNLAFKNWFGLYCTNCGGIIPCLMNVFSLLILVITFPIWIGFRTRLKALWLSKQPARYAAIKPQSDGQPFDSNNWWVTGLSFSLVTFVIECLFSLIEGDGLSGKTLIASGFTALVGGIAFGLLMKQFLYTKPRKQSNTQKIG